MSTIHQRLGVAGPRWQAVRRLVLERDGWRCVRCGVAARLQVDHVVALEHGGAPWDLENLQALCVPCHVGKTATERGTWRLPPGRLDRLRRIARED